MKRSPLLLLGALALVTVACEQHPLPGQPPIPENHGAPVPIDHAAPAAPASHGEVPAAAGEAPKPVH